MINWFRRRKKRRSYPEGDSIDLEELKARAYDYLDVYDMDGQLVPLILFEDDRFEKLMSWHSKSLSSHFKAEGAGRGFTVRTDLNILRDYRGNVFVEVILTFPNGMDEKIMIDARIHLKFFEQLALSTMLAISPMSDGNNSKIFLIQIPKAQNAENALDMIKRGLQDI